jgi:hypothetical protein
MNRYKHTWKATREASRSTPCTATTHLAAALTPLYLAARRDYSSSAAHALRQPRRAPRLLVSGRTCSTSTLLCAVTTRHPATRALCQPRRAPRVLVSTVPAAAIYIASAARPGASARHAALHAAHHAAHRRILRDRHRLLRLRRASECLGTSRGPSHGSSSTTPCTATSSCGHAGSTSATPCVVTTCLAATLALLRVHRAPPRRRLPVASRRPFILTNFPN